MQRKEETLFFREVVRAKWMILKSFDIMVRAFMAVLLDGFIPFQESISCATEHHVIDNRVKGLKSSETIWNSCSQKCAWGTPICLLPFFSAVLCIWHAPSSKLLPASLISLVYSSFKA